jgi:hypothetical protein
MCRLLKWFRWVLLLAILTGCNLRQGNVTNTPFPTPDIPRAQFLFPQNNSTVLEGTDLEIDLLAEDTGSGIARVELLVDDLPYRESSPQVSPAVPAFTVKMNWLAQGVGIHSMTVIAYRADGTASAPVLILVEVLPRPAETP